MNRQRSRRGLKRTVCGGALLLLSAASGWLFVESAGTQHHWVWSGDPDGYGSRAVGIARGVFFYAAIDTPTWTRGHSIVDLSTPGIDWLRPLTHVDMTGLFIEGRLLIDRSTTPGYSLTRVVAWPLPLGLAVTGAWLVWRGVVARRRSAAGHCPACGYDLRGLSAGATCPECGHAGAGTPA